MFKIKKCEEREEGEGKGEEGKERSEEQKEKGEVRGESPDCLFDVREGKTNGKRTLILLADTYIFG